MFHSFDHNKQQISFIPCKPFHQPLLFSGFIQSNYSTHRKENIGPAMMSLLVFFSFLSEKMRLYLGKYVIFDNIWGKNTYKQIVALIAIEGQIRLEVDKIL